MSIVASRRRAPSVGRGGKRSQGSAASRPAGVAGLLARLVALSLLGWIAGFLWFVTTLPRPAKAATPTDGIVVLTGGPGRLAHATRLLEAGQASRLLVSGVDPSVRMTELAAELQAPGRLFACCIDLGREALDTRGNAAETAAWVRRHGFRSIRLVTADYHLPRARLEVGAQLNGGVRIVADPVPADPTPWQLAREFSKYLWRRAAVGLHLG